MSNKSVLTGVVLLESFWATRKKDMLDLIAPFIIFGVAKTTALSEEIKLNIVTDKVRSEFGYSDIPSSVVAKILSRDKDHFLKKNRKFYLKKLLDSEVERIESRKRECDQRIDEVGKDLLSYLQCHCKKTKVKDEHCAIDLLQNFFASFSLQIENNTLEFEQISYKEEEVNYYIAQYIFEKKRQDSYAYSTILELTKGFLHKTAVYLQGENSNITTAAYKNTKVFYDTPFLLQLLGYQEKDQEQAAKNLHVLLRKQGAQLFYFPQTETELLSILTAYQYSLIGEQRSSKTLPGLDEKKYTFDSVSRLKLNINNILRDEYGVTLHELPGYITDSSKCVEEDSVDIDEQQAIVYVHDHTKHYSDENLLSDVSSALAIHRLRDGVSSTNIEQCRAIFLTTNIDFTKAFNNFYSKNFGRNRVMPVITAFDLSAIAWVKSGSIDKSIPERQLLANAYSAMQPAPEILEKCLSVLNQLESEGKISKDEATSLMADRVIQKELWIDYFPSVESIDEEYIEKLREKQRKQYIGEEKQRIEEKYKKEDLEKEQKRVISIQKRARKYAEEKKNRYIKVLKWIIGMVFVVLFAFCAIGLMKSLVSVEITIFLIAFMIVSVLSIFDTLNSRGRILNKWIQKKANRYETKKYEEKLKEYSEI